MTNFLENKKIRDSAQTARRSRKEKHFWYRYGDRYETKAITLENLAT